MKTGQVTVRSTVTCCMSVRMSHYVSTYQHSLSAGTYTVTCPFYICPHAHPGTLVARSSAHTGPQTNTTISHTPTHPEMLEILSRRDNMFAIQSLTRSPVPSAWLKLTHSSVHARSWLKWHFSFFTFTVIFTFSFIPCFFWHLLNIKATEWQESEIVWLELRVRMRSDRGTEIVGSPSSFYTCDKKCCQSKHQAFRSRIGLREGEEVNLLARVCAFIPWGVIVVLWVFDKPSGIDWIHLVMPTQEVQGGVCGKLIDLACLKQYSWFLFYFFYFLSTYVCVAFWD